jgi:hypothetical protein
MLRSFAKGAAFVLVVAIAWFVWPWRAIEYPPGIIAPDAPLQTSIARTSLGEVNGFALEAVATYELTARVLRTKRYHGGPGSKIVPVDVAVAWGRMSDQSVLDQLKISQSNRFFFYRWSTTPPIPPAEIVAHAANMHVIPANNDVAWMVRWLRAGQLVRMRGYLVNVTGPGGFRWNTSLSRSDSGNGACELYYVESVERLEAGS